MGENSKIAWCDDTFNPWIGCQKVSAGCQNCYAEKLAHFHGWVKEWGKDYRLTSEANWKKPIQWAKQAVKDGVTKRVFCASLADVFDRNIQDDWWIKLFYMIYETEKIGGLEWLILTKRPENIHSFYDEMLDLKSIRIGITCENQEMYDKRVPVLLDAWHGKNFISYEPALSLLHLGSYGYKIDWIIAGCESGTNARTCKTEWIQILRDQTSAFEIPFFLKQLVIDGKLTAEPELDGRKWLEFPK
jgi:protein gp37